MEGREERVIEVDETWIARDMEDQIVLFLVTAVVNEGSIIDVLPCFHGVLLPVHFSYRKWQGYHEEGARVQRGSMSQNYLSTMEEADPVYYGVHGLGTSGRQDGGF